MCIVGVCKLLQEEHWDAGLPVGRRVPSNGQAREKEIDVYDERDGLPELERVHEPPKWRQ